MRLPSLLPPAPRGLAGRCDRSSLIWALPLVLNDSFFILVLQSLAYLFIVALGLDILVGWTGQISLGHAGLYAVGAYTSALLATKAGCHFWVSAPLGVLFAGVAGALLATALAARQRPVPGDGDARFRLHGGGDGESLGVSPAARWASPRSRRRRLPGGEEMTPTQYFWLILAARCSCQLLANNLLGSRVGRTLLALRGSEIAAADRRRSTSTAWKVLAFVFSSAIRRAGRRLLRPPERLHQQRHVRVRALGLSSSPPC